MIRAVTFDFWDTLVADDSDEPRRARMGLPTKAQSRLLLLVGEIARYHPGIQPEQIAQAFAHANERFRRAWKEEYHTPTVAQRLQDVYGYLHIERTPGFDDIVRHVEEMELIIRPRFVDGVAETLAQLAGNYKLGIISDAIHTSGRGIRTLLAGERVLQYFRSFVFSDEAGASKPRPTVFERASAELAIPLSEIVHVGDRESNDVEGPLAVGMKAVLFTGVVDRGSATTRAHAVCDTFDQLPDVIQELGR
jgi:putative hydrolase of the HAD superfamily